MSYKMRKWKRILTVLLSMILVVTSAIIPTNQIRAAEGKSESIYYTGDGFDVNFQVTSRWPGAWNGSVTITNTSDKEIDNWAIGFSMPYEITNLWNGAVNAKEDGYYVIKNATFNQDIPKGKSINFGFTAKVDGDIILPSEFSLLCYEKEVEKEFYEVSFQTTSDWKTAFNGEIRIKNLSDTTIEDWKLQFDFEVNIDRFYTATILEKLNHHYSIKNAGYNSNIKPGETLILGFSGNPGNVSTNPENIILTQITQEANFTESEKDTDKDGLIDSLEKEFGTDPKKVDTDEDLLNDYIEVLLDLNPLIKDSDGNGIEDGDEDTDRDGLSNLDEIKLSLDYTKKDTDSDGLLDGEEVLIYKTSPILQDTDGDTLPDGDEIKLGLNPLTAFSDGVTHDSNRRIPQELHSSQIEDKLLVDDNLLIPSLSGQSAKVLDKEISVQTCDYDALRENRAIISNPIEIQTKLKEDNKLELSFNYSNFLSYYSEADADMLLICQFVGDDFLPLDTKKDELNHTIYADISGEGVYFVLNLEEFLNTVGIDPIKEISTFSDSSSSIELNDVATGSAIKATPLTEVNTTELSKDDEVMNQVEPLGDNANDVSNEWYQEYFKEQELWNSFDSQLTTEDNYFSVNSSDYTTYATPRGQADITFVIDTTGSMSSAIRNVTNNITNFVDRLTTEYNVQVNFSLVDYKDILADGTDSTKLIKNGTSNWFSNVDLYKSQIRNLYVTGGGDGPETPIDGLGLAYKLDYRSNANKFIILVTDANYKVNNQYGITSMEQIAGLLKEKGITTSVIAPTSYRSIYASLFEKTDGIFADIYGNFSAELMMLADKIGETVNDGSWVLLSDYQFVKLKSEVSASSGVDTDEDGLSDYRELGAKFDRDLTSLIRLFLEKKLVPMEYYTGKTSVSVYQYASNPVLLDTDYDGMEDTMDTNPKDNKFSGTLHSEYADSEVSYVMDYRSFFSSNASYNSAIGTIASLYSSVVYHGNTLEGMGLKAFLEKHGIQDVKQYDFTGSYSDSDVSEAYIGHRKVTYNGETREVIAIVVRGTNGTLKEWSSNFDIGNTNTIGSFPDWKVKENHKGFDVAATRILRCLQQYENLGVIDQTVKKVYWVMGHSRGAGISNIIGARLINESKYVYAYTYAAPNTTTASNAGSYVGIYNILNKDDFVPYLPMSRWGFTHYGKSVTISIADNYEKEWEDLTGCKNMFGVVDYNIDAIGMDTTIKKLGDIVNNRNECYVYTCDCHGDGTLDNITIRNYGTSKSSREGAIAKIPENALPYCKITRYDGFLIAGWDFEVCQQPEYFMQVLAAFMADSIGATRFATELNIADRYESAKSAIIRSGLGGLEHPHYTESYYLLSTHIAASSFQ